MICMELSLMVIQTSRKILTPDDFEGHPLRKDYPVDGRQPATLTEIYRKDGPRRDGDSHCNYNTPDDHQYGSQHPSTHGVLRLCWNSMGK